MDRFTKCNGCKALDGLEWECRLGYPLLVHKQFVPAQECPKPLTEEDYQDEKFNSKSKGTMSATTSDMESCRSSLCSGNKAGS